MNISVAWRGLGAVALWAMAMSVSPPALAQERTELDRLFEESRRDPDNLDLLFELARVAVELEDYEAAVGALERMLIFNPDLPRVRLELGALYFRLGSYELARAYLQQVSRALEREPNPVVEERVRELLAAVDQKTQSLRVGGQLSLALAHHSNPATQADSGTTVNLNLGGSDLLSTQGQAPDSDQRLQFFGNLLGRYDLKTAYDDAWEAELRVFSQEYRDQSDLNLGVVETSVGPALGLERWDLPGVLRPFVVGSYVRYNDERLFWEGGGGLQWRGPASGELGAQAQASYEYRVRRHQDSPRAVVTPRDGDYHRVALRVRTGGQHRWRLESGLDLRDYRADTEHNSFSEWQVHLGLGRRLVLLRQPAQWRTTLGFTHADYDGPDPVIQRNRTRSDGEVRASTMLSLWFTRNWSGTLSVEYIRRSSSVPIYEYDGWAGTLGVSWRF